MSHGLSPRLLSNTARILEAAEWRLLSLLLERPRPGWYEEIVAGSREVRDVALRSAAEAARGATEGEYLRLLGPGGLVSPREVTYRPMEDPGHVLAKLATVYEAFAFHPRAEDPIDHIAIEVGFVGYLLLKEAFADARGDSDAAATTRAARQMFLETHLALVGGPFNDRLRAAGDSYLLEPARVLCARVPPPPAPPSQSNPTASVDGCGSCSAI